MLPTNLRRKGNWGIRENHFKFILKNTERKTAIFVLYSFSFFIINDNGYILITDLSTEKKKGLECSLYNFEGIFLEKIYFKKIPRSLKIKRNKSYGIVYTKEGWAKAVRYNIN